MENKHFATVILIICLFSLIVGIFAPNKNEDKVVSEKLDTSVLMSNVENISDKIAVLNIDGAISANAVNNQWSDEFSLDSFLASIERAKKDKKVKAVIVRINSPGGTVAASQDIYDALLRLRKSKPLVISMADVAASGGYYVASTGDRIVAQSGTMTGSIGVIFNFMDVAQLADKVGVTSHVIKSGQFKDSGSMYRKMTSSEQKLFQTSVDTAYKQFIDDIAKARINRNDNYSPDKTVLTMENLKKYADGRIFLGEEAQKLGFVDIIGSQYEAQVIASKMAGSDKLLPMVSYNKITGLKSLLMGIENKFSHPIKEILPFSYKHNLQPLVIWE